MDARVPLSSFTTRLKTAVGLVPNAVECEDHVAGVCGSTARTAAVGSCSTRASFCPLLHGNDLYTFGWGQQPNSCFPLLSLIRWYHPAAVCGQKTPMSR